MVSGNDKTPGAIRGLREIYKRIAGFHGQHAFFMGKPLHCKGPEPIGILSSVPEYRDRLYLGGFGCGKTYILDYTGLVLLAEQPDNMGLFIRKRFEQLRNTTLATFYDIVEEAGDGDKNALIADTDESEGAIQLMIRTAGKPSKAIFRVEPDGTEASVRDSVKGYTLGFFGADELTQLRKVTFDTLRTRLRREGVVTAGLAASNPASHIHWVTQTAQLNERELEQGLRPEILVVRSRSFDNPYLRSDYVEQLKRQYKDDPAGYDMYVLGKDGLEIQGKPVFRRDFNEVIHLDRALKFIPYDSPLYVGLDFGYHRPAAVWFQRDQRDRYNVLAELCPSDLGVDAFADMIMATNQRHFPFATTIRYFGDPAGAQVSDKGMTTIKQLAQRGITVNYRRAEVNDGIEKIRQLLQKNIDGRPRLIFHPRCRLLVEAMRGGYYYRERADHSYTDKPYKDGNYDHVVDALRYGVDNLVQVTNLGHLALPEKAEGLKRIEVV